MTRENLRHVEKKLQDELVGLQQLLDSRLVVQQVDREIVIRLMRLVEITIHGEAKTEITPRHHA